MLFFYILYVVTPSRRHDILKRIWCCITCRTGVSTSLEPVLRPLRSSYAAIANRPESQEGILLALQDALSVVDVSVVHPAAAACVNTAACVKGTAAAVGDQAKHVQYEIHLTRSAMYLFCCQQRLWVGKANLPWRC